MQDPTTKHQDVFVRAKPPSGSPGLDTGKPTASALAVTSHLDEHVPAAKGSEVSTAEAATILAPWPVAIASPDELPPPAPAEEAAEPLHVPTDDGKPHLHHEAYDDGSTFDGQILKGQRHGVGQWKSSFESYDGQWFEDHRHGQGKQTWNDGRMYTGQFYEGKFHGQGRMDWSTPQGVTTYDGEYEDDLKHGHGRFSWPDGRVYEGQWSRGTRSGKATYINPKGQKRSGVWKDDKLERWLDGPDGSSVATP